MFALCAQQANAHTRAHACAPHSQHQALRAVGGVVEQRKRHQERAPPELAHVPDVADHLHACSTTERTPPPPFTSTHVVGATEHGHERTGGAKRRERMQLHREHNLIAKAGAGAH
jgi:hypothetical protein